jgi:APA family basic amino acid/polyamine antiporter
LSVEEIAATDRVAALVAERAFGSAGGTIVSVTILVSIFGALNAGILAAPRVYYAQARDGLFFKTFAEVHPKFGTPASAVLLQGVWAAILSASGSYLQLLSFAMFAAWIFYAMAVFGVIVLRRRRPQAERPYRMWGYPVTPALFVLASIWLVANTLAANFGPSIAVLATIAAGAPAYLWMRNRSS